MFKESFKYYKRKSPPPTYEEVIDIQKISVFQHQLEEIKLSTEILNNSEWLISSDKWKVYNFLNLQGLKIISNPFTPEGQRYWVRRCLCDFTQKPNKLNVDNFEEIPEGKSWWEVCQNNPTIKESLIKKLRWITMGYHHNWDTKVYSEENQNEMPSDLNYLSYIVTKQLGFSYFKAEAAIINFYHDGCTLAPHTDHSEKFLDAPLISISFGRPAIFLIGTSSLEDKPLALFLRSGDIVIMSGKSRLSYHSVPRIMRTYEINDKFILPWISSSNSQIENDWTSFHEYLLNSRINLNIRQVHEKK